MKKSLFWICVVVVSFLAGVLSNHLFAPPPAKDVVGDELLRAFFEEFPPRALVPGEEYSTVFYHYDSGRCLVFLENGRGERQVSEVIGPCPTGCFEMIDWYTARGKRCPTRS